MTDFRKGDRVRLEGVVTGIDPEHGRVSISRYSVYEVDLELVERPGPRLEDLPDGTVLRRADCSPRQATTLIWLNGVIVNQFGKAFPADYVSWPFEVIGGCPGLPAWDLFMRGNAGWNVDSDDDDDLEWWRSE